MNKKKNPPSFKKLLIPVDFSSHSERAVDYGCVIGKKFSAGVILMHVIEPFQYSVTDTLKLIDHRRALQTLAESLLDNLEKTLREKGVRAQAVLGSGIPYREILHHAEEQKVDLIVMGTHGRTGLERLVLGSVAEKVVRTAPCPVMTVPLPRDEEAARGRE